MLVIGVMAATVVLWMGIYAAWGGGQYGAAFWAPIVVSTVIATTAAIASAGCFVSVDKSTGEVRDVIAWRTVRRIDQRSIVAARVRAGAWRWFDIEFGDGSHVALLGASPTQFPARLLPDGRVRDLADLDLLMGPDPMDRASPQQETNDTSPGTLSSGPAEP